MRRIKLEIQTNFDWAHVCSQTDNLNFLAWCYRTAIITFLNAESDCYVAYLSSCAKVSGLDMSDMNFIAVRRCFFVKYLE